MICFTIALRGKASTNHWDDVVRDFNNTLHSIFNQTCDEFHVFVGCNEIPELWEKYDRNRLHFIEVNTPVPKTWQEKCRDRSWKLLNCAKAIRDRFGELSVQGGVFVFPVDADDYVNCHIAAYVKAHPEANGFKSKSGYKWIKNRKIMVITPYYGGSMNIMKMYLDELPEGLPDISLCFDEKTSAELGAKYPIKWFDIEVEGKFAALGRRLDRLPFRSTIYVLGTGENISEKDPKNKRVDKKRIQPVAFLRRINPFDKKLLTARIKREFGILE
ncbi:MAG: hypothetical protein E7321_00485 [Clostridiales bacterium]|nr:hypothetical protein [Clostridiales bacterium]